MKIEIICPVYNAEKYILNLNNLLLDQEKIEIYKITYILTESTDNTEKLILENKLNYIKINKEEFSHSMSREKVALNSDADILVFITQDIKPNNTLWLYNLIKDIQNGSVDACYSRQISEYNNIEKYTRQKNYPDKSFVVSKEDIKKLGLKTFFFSDASSAIRKETFVKLNGYDNKTLPTNEDMYIAYKLIINGYKIKYCANSEILHSHNFTLKQLYKRYYDTGIFFVLVPEINKYNQTKTGIGLAKYILIQAIKEKNVKVLLRFVPDMLARYFGMKKGKKDGRRLG